ncbi:hypothetical protein ABBQ38_011229 [Trebouxia sp. C0009 RCD-2024]
MQADSTPFVLGMQDVDGQLRDFQDKQNIDIGLIMGRNSNSVSTVSERMPVFSRATIMRMGTARSLSVSTLRPKGRQSGVEGQAGPTSPDATGTGWQEPSMSFQDLPGSETTSTPTRVRQFLKKGVVKFQEAAASVSSVVGQPFISGTSSGSYGPRMQLGAPSRRRSVARLGPPLPRRRTSDENADAHSVSEFEWDGGSTADVMLASRATSSRSRRSSVSAPEHAFPQMIADVEPLSGMRRYPSLSLGNSWERHILSQQPTGLPKQGSEQQDMMTFHDEVPSSPGLLAIPCPDDAIPPLHA